MLVYDDFVARIDMANGWGVSLQGEATDIEDWEHVFKPPFDPWVEVHGSETVLRSKELDSLSTALDVREHAIALIARLNGIVALSEGARPVSIGSVIEFAPDGSLKRTAFGEGSATCRSKVRGVSSTLGPDAQPLLKQSLAQEWATICDEADYLQDAIIHFGRSDNWFDLYKCIEYIYKVYGDQHEFENSNHETKAEVKRIKNYANSHRHGPRRGPEPSHITLVEARSYLSFVLRQAFDYVRNKHAALGAR